MRRCFSFLLLAGPLTGQQAAVPPSFEVASIRQCVEGGQRVPPIRSSPGRLSLTCWPLRRLIQEAYDIFATGTVNPLNPSFPFTPLEGGPNWMDSVRYTINAHSSGSESVAWMRGPMMRTLLEDRFRLQVHRETREVPVYVMTVAADRPKLKRTEEGTCNALDPLDPTQSLRVEPGGKPWCVITTPSRQESRMVWDVKGMSLGVFAKLINPGRPVIDRTGLAGTYDIHLEWWTSDPTSLPHGGAADSPGSAFALAIRKQLGLQLEPGKGPREFLVIDHLERPAEN